MIKLCKNCGYIRKPTDKTHEDECPSCGVFYRKFKKEIKEKPINSDAPEILFNIESNENEKEFTYYQSYMVDIKDWCDNSNFMFRIPVLIFYFYVLAKMLFDHTDGSIFNGINMGIHEGGHPLFSYLGRWMAVAGGTILQWFAPLVCTIALLKQRDYFGITFGLVWFATSMIQTSVYMADARALVLPLVTIGGTSGPVAREDMHDFHILFNSVGLIEWDTTIAMMVYITGIIILFVAISLACLLTWWMYQGFRKTKNPLKV